MSTPTTVDKYIQIDENGYFIFDGQKLEDRDSGQKLLLSLKYDELGRTTVQFGEQTALVESYDDILVAHDIFFTQDTENSRFGKWQIQLPYEVVFEVEIESLSVDSWDRFHGLTTNGIPFVLSRAAQSRFFDLVESFDDDSVTISGRQLPIQPWLQKSVANTFTGNWNDRYKNNDTPWDLNQPHPCLMNIIPQLKLPRSRIVVLGCGRGHDAAYLAQQGHLVLGVDMSPLAIEDAKKLYGAISGLEFLVGDALRPKADHIQQFDIVFEHTLYCAIYPEQRDQLVSAWTQWLKEDGHLLGVFVAQWFQGGPPFGGSEWEIRKRLNGLFDVRYWTRWHLSPERRKSMELVVYAQKR